MKRPNKIVTALGEAVSLSDDPELLAFLAESNRIEGVMSVRAEEIEAARHFLSLRELFVADVCSYVSVTAGAELRIRAGMDVRVGNHIAPRGGPGIGYVLMELLGKISRNEVTPYLGHVAFEALHPFEDGNGRSGRLVWLWQVRRYYGGRLAPMGFLQSWYYASLEAAS